MDYTTRKILVDDDQRQENQIIRPKNISSLFARLSVLCLTTFYFGYSLVYISSLRGTTLVDTFGQTLSQPVAIGFLIGCLPLGAMLGSALSIPLIPLFSRKALTLLICIFSIILEGVIQVPNIVALYVCRSLQGVCSGLFMALIPIYINQLAPKQIAGKGIFGVFSTLFVIIGVMTAFSLNIVFIEAQLWEAIRWRIIFGINFIAVCIVTICLLINYIPQSPNSLIQNKQQQKAKQVIALFNKKRFVQQIYAQRQKDVQRSKKPFQTPVQQNSFLRTFLVFQLPLMQQLTGINAFVAQMGSVAESYGFNFGQFVPVIMGIVQFIAAVYSMTCLAKVRRRPMVLVGNLLMGICSLGMGIVFLFQKSFPAGFWIVVPLIFIYMTIHGGTLIPGVWLYVGQVSKGNSPKYSSVTNWFMCGATIVIFPIINTNYGFAPMFLTFGVLSLILFILNYFLMIETKQKTLAQKNFQLRLSN